jgi:hypothetical protein
MFAKAKTFLLPILMTVMMTLSFVPAASYAQNNNNNQNSCNAIYQQGQGLGGILDVAICLLNRVIPILVTAAVIVFVYGIVLYIRNADNADKRKEGNMFILYGLIGLFVMVTMWALVAILANTFGQQNLLLPTLPQ